MARKRVNISLDPATYERLQEVRAAYKFKNTCELVVAFVHILLDRMTEAERRQYDVPEDDGQYLDQMFADLADFEKTPANTNPPKQHRTRRK